MRVFAWVERWLARRSAAIVAISEYEKASGTRVGIPAEKIQVIRLGLGPCSPSLSAVSRAELSGPLRLLFLGRFDRQKGLDWLLEVVRGMGEDEVQLVVAGAAVTDGECVPDEVPPNTQLRGWLSPAEVDQQIAVTDAVIVPSRWEGFGLVVIEALRQGVPALVSDRGALPEVVGAGEGGVVFAFGDSNGLQHLLRTLTRKQLQKLGAQGKMRFEREFSQQRMRDDTIALYRRVSAGENLAD